MPTEYDDPAALIAASPLSPPLLEIKYKPLFELSVEFTDVDPMLIDLLLYGQSPGPQFPLGEN